jgi:uncharacterized Rossmann fold enzyme
MTKSKPAKSKLVIANTTSALLAIIGYPHVLVNDWDDSLRKLLLGANLIG